MRNDLRFWLAMVDYGSLSVFCVTEALGDTLLGNAEFCSEPKR